MSCSPAALRRALEPVSAVCYSGYRAGQSPDAGLHPSYQETREDLLLLAPHFRALRLYDCGPASETVLEVITRERLDFTVMLGAWIAAEVDNPDCPWGGLYAPEVLERNRSANRERITALAELASRYPAIVTSVSAGNEATVGWTDHRVPVESVVTYARMLRAAVEQPVTFCDNYVPWGTAVLDALAPEVDFLSLHTYPVWESIPLAEALAYTAANYQQVAERHPGKPLVITEAGWPTRSNGRGVAVDCASEALQAAYCAELQAWSRARGVLTYLFEAFDEPWKGSPDPAEPEKHWGLFSVDRRPKPALRALFPGAA